MMRIHQEISSGAFPNATTLSQALEVTTRTVARDLDFMRDRLNLPIEYDPARTGYYYTGPVSSFPTLQITEGELLALVVAEKALQQYRGTNFEKPLVSAFRKLAAQLPDTISFSIADWEQTISFRTSAEPLLNLDIFDVLARATASRKQLRFNYRKPGQRRPETRVVDPYHLANINGEWFLFAFDHARNDVRTFVPMRIAGVQETGKTFARPAKFSLDQRLSDSFGVVAGHGEFNVVIHFTASAADYIHEKRWHSSQKIRDLPDGGVELRMTLSSLAEVQRWILSWSGQAQPVAPPELVASVREAASRILAAARP